MSGDQSDQHPVVSGILPIYNEVRYIETCLASLLGQETPDFDLEILAIDGKSTDGTREILDQIACADSRVRVLVNEKRKTPFAINLGLREARGKYVCIFGSHAIYKRDYISVCLKELAARGAVGCAGRVITLPSHGTRQARLVVWALTHPFGSSRESFRNQPEGYAVDVRYPLLVKEALIKAGGYDLLLAHNQKSALHQKLRSHGYKLYCTWKTQCFHRPIASLKSLLACARANGFWNVISLREKTAARSARHFVPFIFLVILLGCVLLALAGLFLPAPYAEAALIPLVTLLGLHLCAGWLAALQIAWRERTLVPLYLPPIFLSFHVAYGYGTLRAFASNVRLLASLPRLFVSARNGPPSGESASSQRSANPAAIAN